MGKGASPSLDSLKRDLAFFSNEELLDMWGKRDGSKKDFEASIAQVLHSRNVTLPADGGRAAIAGQSIAADGHDGAAGQTPEERELQTLQEYLGATAKAAPAPAAPPPSTWEIKSQDGSILALSDEQEIIKAILADAISADDDCRRITPTAKGEAQKEPKWKHVSDSLAKSSFAVRKLFQPVWAYTLKGGEVGVAVGMSLWLCMNAFSAFSLALQAAGYDNDNAKHVAVKFASYGIVSLFFLSQNFTLFAANISHTLVKKLVVAFSNNAPKFSLIALALIGIGSKDVGAVFGGAVTGMSSLLGVLVAGSLAGGLPGMVIGTSIGFVWAPRLPKAPSAREENKTAIIVKGIALPVVAFATAATLYVLYAGRLAEWAMEGFLH